MEASSRFKKSEDNPYVRALLNEKDRKEISPDEQKERDTALIQITDKAQEFSDDQVLIRILSMLMDPTFEGHARRMLVKVLNGVVNKLGELVWPFTHKVLVVIEPMLIDVDDNARVEGREAISVLSKAVGLDYMITAMLPDIDCCDDENVRKMTAIAFSVVASALGISAVLPFLKAVCQSKRSSETRQAGMEIVQEIAILMGSAVLPHLRSLLEIIVHGINDEDPEVRSAADLSLAALAEAAGPDGLKIIMEIKQRKLLAIVFTLVK